MMSSALYLVPVLDCLSQRNSELTVALQDLGNPATNDDAGLDKGCNYDDGDNEDGVDGDDDVNNEDGSTCRTLSRPWPLARWGGCSPPEASCSRSPDEGTPGSQLCWW